MLSLFRMFSRFRNLERMCEDLNTATVRMQDQLFTANATISRLQALYDTALENERRALHTMANVGYQQVYGFKPHPDAPGVPDARMDSAPPGPVPSLYAQGQEVCRRDTNAAARAYMQSIDSQAAAREIFLRKFGTHVDAVPDAS